MYILKKHVYQIWVIQDFMESLYSQMNVIPYVNGIILRAKTLSGESCWSYDFKVCFLLGLDLSKLVLWFSVHQRAAKLKICQSLKFKNNPVWSTMPLPWGRWLSPT